MLMLRANSLTGHLLACVCIILLASSAQSFTDDQSENGRYALSLHGDIKYPEGFSHFGYANPKAPKGGTIRLGSIGAFDSLNPFVPKGTAADDIGLLYDTLTTASADEPFTHYGLLAEKIFTAHNNTWVEYQLRQNARFADGTAVTAEDVAFTFNLLMEQGAPQYKVYYADVEKVEAVNSRRVRFSFKHGNNAELPLILGGLPVLPKHFWADKDFSKSSLITPLGSGPYKISSFEAGRQIVFERRKDYWARDLNVNRGLYNFDKIIYDYYRDATVAVTALKSGEFDLRHENSSKNWATEYKESKNLIQLEIPDESPTGMQAFVMNLRNPLFEDMRVREALELSFDFEWTNKNLFYNAYSRSYSFFTKSELAATGLPEGKELELLEQFRGQIPNSVFNEEYKPSVTDGSGKPRSNLRKAKYLLEDAGWKVSEGLLKNQAGKTFEFKILLASPAFERIVNPWVKNLARLGIKANVEVADIPRYINHLRQFEFDMIVSTIPQSLSPGNEQRHFWSSEAADTPSSRNFAGIKNPVVDALVETLIQAKTREQLVTACRALDRVLLHNHYVIPQWYNKSHRIAMKDIFGRPDIAPKYDPAFTTTLHTWWIK